MCGIAGYFLPGKTTELPVIQEMCRRIWHRGPDDEGVRVEGDAAIGMRRLSIIDLHSGHQPIANEDHTVWVVFNGEIYNYRELSEFLRGRGHQFRTQSDTEALVHLYEEEGVEGWRLLRGMFAFCIWDTRRQSMLLVRDRFGKKPLYYSVRPEGLYFGSELKCLAAAGVPLETDEEALRWYFQFSYIPDPASPYVGIRKLKPGGWLRFERSGAVTEGTYWQFPEPAAEAPSGWTEARAVEEVRAKFDEAVRVRLVSDVPLGAFLSGGIDSSSVVASMAAQTREPVRTFSIGFEEAAYNELPYARQVAERYQTQHHELVVRPDSVQLAGRLVRHFDEPFGDSSAIPTFLVSEFAAQHVKVTLTGDGGDELFAGYESFFALEKLRWLDRVPQLARRMLGAVADRLPYEAYGKNWLRMASRPTALMRYFELNYTPHFLQRRLVSRGHWLPAEEAYWRQELGAYLLPGDVDVLRQALHFEATAKLTGDMLVKVDRMSMAASLEVRCPMLDHELAELAMRVPARWNLRDGHGKDILIRALRDRLPAELLTRPKKGFGVPLPLWLRTSLREMVWDHLTSRRFLERGWVDGAFVRYLLEEHDRQRRDNYHWIWMLLMLELWFRERESEAARI